MTVGLTVHIGAAVEIDAAKLYEILRLRVDVFVVEQQCAYPELDGRDLDSGCRLLWIEAGDEVVACARVLPEGDGSTRIGRIATRRAHRGQGLAAMLVAAAARAGEPPWVLDAQSHLRSWYERLGFAVTGPEFVEDGIPHLPMRRTE